MMTNGARIDSTGNVLRDNSDIALVSRFVGFAENGGSRLATLGVVLEEVRTEVVFFDFGGNRRVQRG